MQKRKGGDSRPWASGPRSAYSADHFHADRGPFGRFSMHVFQSISFSLISMVVSLNYKDMVRLAVTMMDGWVKVSSVHYELHSYKRSNKSRRPPLSFLSN
jgi:hypothetical protein